MFAADAAAIYDRVTDNRSRHVRLDRLLVEAAAMAPGLLPSADDLAAEAQRPLKDKQGIETDQALFLSHLFADRERGQHLCHAMLLPLAQSVELLPRLMKQGSLDLGTVAVGRLGKASVVEMRNSGFLNALDDSTIAPLETAVDLAIMDPATEIAVLRGGIIQGGKYAGRRIFSAGINLTRLYQGKIPLCFYFEHLLGYEHKIFRGLARPDATIDDIAGTTREKIWIAAVDGFAIGGGCQHLLVMDYVLAARDAYLTLPARKEGIIPGAANLRLWRFTGDRIARQAILYGRRLDCDTPEGRLICDEIAAPAAIDDALERVVDGFTSSGVVSAAGNRRALRVAEEPLDTFRRYMAVYAREQALCHFSPALIANLERNWNAHQRAG
jgi:thioesterase DpgC